MVLALSEHYGMPEIIARLEEANPNSPHDPMRYPYFLLLFLLLVLAQDHVPGFQPRRKRTPDRATGFELVWGVEQKRREGAKSDSAAIEAMQQQSAMFKGQDLEALLRRLTRARKDPVVKLYLARAQANPGLHQRLVKALAKTPITLEEFFELGGPGQNG